MPFNVIPCTLFVAQDGNELTQEEEDGDKAGSGMDGEDKDREKTYKPSMVCNNLNHCVVGT